MQASEPALATLRDLINRSTEVDEADQVTLFMPTEAAFGEVSGVMATLDTETVSDVRPYWRQLHLASCLL